MKKHTEAQRTKMDRRNMKRGAKRLRPVDVLGCNYTPRTYR